MRLDGVEILPCVSQGAAPIGPELTITAADGHIIGELAGKPALAKLREAIEGLSDDDRDLVDGGLLMGIVVDTNKPDYVQGDFLVRGLVGADPRPARSRSAPRSRPGQVVRLHARDADERRPRPPRGARASAWRRSAAASRRARSCSPATGAARDVRRADHDAEAVASTAGRRAGGGFFAAGEIGPVGGEYFLHGFTATVAVFAR